MILLGKVCLISHSLFILFNYNAKFYVIGMFLHETISFFITIRKFISIYFFQYRSFKLLMIVCQVCNHWVIHTKYFKISCIKVIKMDFSPLVTHSQLYSKNIELSLSVISQLFEIFSLKSPEKDYMIYLLFTININLIGILSKKLIFHNYLFQ